MSPAWFGTAPIITLMLAFYSDLARNKPKDTPFRHAEFKRLLHETGVLAPVGSKDG